MILLYVNSYTSKICMFVGVPQYTILFTVYNSPHIRFTAYKILLLYDSPLYPFLSIMYTLGQYAHP